MHDKEQNSNKNHRRIGKLTQKQGKLSSRDNKHTSPRRTIWYSRAVKNYIDLGKSTENAYIRNKELNYELNVNVKLYS